MIHPNFRSLYRPGICALVLCVACLGSCNRNARGPLTMDSPVPPEHAAATFELEPGFQIELIASEPLIADPVAMEIDENGNLYVVENHGYPLDKSRNSKVKLLRDTDGDGRMDQSTIFADTLLMPTGVMRWKNGILVTDAPDLLYMEDTNGDGKADIIQRMLTGFALSNPQHNVNSPLFGLDNWIYIAHERTVGSEVYKGEFGDQGSDVHFPDKPEGARLPQNANGRNIRLRPDTHELEMLASTTQYGHTFDVWGNHLLVNNSNHLMHSVLAAEYLDRNPDLIVARSTSFPPDHGNAAEVFPITKTPDRQLLTDVGVMTSACGLVAYSGGAFPGAFNTNTTFVAEPVSNIVHADRLKANGSTFIASRVHEEREFLASTDMWCRPVNLYIGPDGALYVVDYYREIIEHPEWLSDEVIQSGKLYNGADMGRIFRVSAVGSQKPSWTTELQLRDATDQELVEKLSDANIWWRRTAQRMLIDRRAVKVVPNLIQMATNARSAPGRLHALWTLEGLGQLKREQIESALRDTEAGVRVNAVKLAELHLDDMPQLQQRLMDLQDDPDAKVRFQLLCTLGSVNSGEAAEVRNKLLFRDLEDEFVQIAALSAPSSQADALLASVIARYKRGTPAYAALVENLAAMVAADRDPRKGYALLDNATRLIPGDSVSWQVSALRGIARSFSMKRATLQPPQQKHLTDAFFEHEALPVRQACLQILQSAKPVDDNHMKHAIERARRVAGDSSESERIRALAINFLALRNPERHADFLKQLIVSGESIPIQLAAIRTLNALPNETITEFTMQRWSTLDPAVQDAALNSFMDKESRVRILLKALEDGKVQPTTVGWQRSIRLMTQRNIELRNRARTFFENDDQRKKVIEDYSSALKLPGDVAKGREVYQRSCAICHQVKGANGIAFGPDLGTIQGWPASGIMANILDPNQSIAHGFDLWNIALKNGESFQGVITAETPSSLTVRNASGEVKTIARDQLASQKALNMSAMPVGLEKQITHQEMADLLAFLRDGK